MQRMTMEDTIRPPEHDDLVRMRRSPRTLEEAATDLASRVRALVGDDAGLTIARPDAAGRLRVLWRDPSRSGLHFGRARHRRVVFTEQRSTLIGIDTERSLAVLPLSTTSASIGTLEIEARTDLLHAAWDTILLLSGHLAMTLHSTQEFERLRRNVETLEAASALGRRLVHAPSTGAALEMAARFMGAKFRLPVAAWCFDNERKPSLVLTSGLGAAARSTLTLATVAADRFATPAEQHTALLDDFRTAADAGSGVALFDGGSSFMIVGRDAEDAGATTVDEVGALLAEMLRLSSATADAAARRSKLDMGLAWTAHELRGPLLGVRAALEAMDRNDADPTQRAVMQSSVRELDHLVGTTDALLTWAAGTRAVHREPEDLHQIARDVVESNRLETGVDAVIVEAPADATVEVDREHVRTAVANLVRNAAAHADPGTQIQIAIAEDAGRLVLSVSDQGPSIPREERRAIFDPFVRGEASGHAREGSGLGLFITRRVVEAHGGTIWVESGERRTTFSLALPVQQRGERLFAS